MKIEVDSEALNKLEAMVQRLQDERDILLTALECLIDSVDHCEYTIGSIGTWAYCFDTARDAISKAKGENNAH